MNQKRAVSKILLLSAAGVFAMAGCADEVTAPQSVADAPQPDTATPPEAAQPDTTAAPEAVEPAAPEADNSTPPETIEPAKVEVGAAAPDFVATGLDGESVSLSDYLGEQNVVLAFSRANW